MGSVTCHRMLAKAGDFCHSGRKIRVTPHRVFGSGFPGSDAASRNSPQGVTTRYISPVGTKPSAFVDSAKGTNVVGFCSAQVDQGCWPKAPKALGALEIAFVDRLTFSLARKHSCWIRNPPSEPYTYLGRFARNDGRLHTSIALIPIVNAQNLQPWDFGLAE
jgi:hypothetical protein